MQEDNDPEADRDEFDQKTHNQAFKDQGKTNDNTKAGEKINIHMPEQVLQMSAFKDYCT